MSDTHAQGNLPDFTPDALAAAGAVGGAPDAGYVWPEDPRTRAALDHWQDLRFGVLIHWGIYSYIGQDGSWSLHRSHLGPFTDPPQDWQGDDADYHTWYNDRARHFTGEDFDAEEWAAACDEAGMAYAIFTSKHHDGFAMYDTAWSSFKSTSEEAGLGRDIFGEVVNAFRARGLETGVYFSKADWNHPGYWDRALPIRDRFHNFDISTRPDVWEAFVAHTHGQIRELLTRYGTMNVLWLDAGWVCEPREPIDADGLADMARSLQPDILVVDREVHGRNENYRTPEQEVPSERLDHPWESCLTFTRGWCSTRPDEPVKPVGDVIANLLAIVSRGGNLLLGIGPDATGAMSPWIRRGLAAIGRWMRINGAGLKGSRPWDGVEGIRGESGWSWYATRAREDSGRVHLFGVPPAVLDPDADLERVTFGEPGTPATEVEVPAQVEEAHLLTDEGEVPCPWERCDGGSLLRVPATGLSHAVGVRLRLAS